MVHNIINMNQFELDYQMLTLMFTYSLIINSKYTIIYYK